MELENYEVKTLSLLTEESVPSDATVLMVMHPKDITEEEEQKIKNTWKTVPSHIFNGNCRR